MTNNGLPDGWKDELTVAQEYGFNWWDRVKVLFGGHLYVSIGVLTEHKIGNNEPRRAVANIRVPWWPKRKPQCYVAEMKP